VAPAQLPPSAQEGFSVFVAWGLVEWALTAMLTAGSVVAIWVWHLGGRTTELERRWAAAEEEVGKMRVEFEKLKGEIKEEQTKVLEKIDDLKANMADKNFMTEGFSNLTRRIDGFVDGRRPWHGPSH
jgi:hypothetical protein